MYLSNILSCGSNVRLGGTLMGEIDNVLARSTWRKQVRLSCVLKEVDLALGGTDESERGPP